MAFPDSPQGPIDSAHALSQELDALQDLSPIRRDARWSRLAVEVFRAIENDELPPGELGEIAALMTDAWAE